MLIGCALCASAAGQVPSAFLHHIQGKVYLDGKLVDDVRPGLKLDQFHTLAKGTVLGTELGLAEILMSPGLIVRVGERTEIMMATPDRGGAVLELKKGAISIEAAEIKDGALSVRHGGAVFTIRKPGTYWVGGEPAEARVYDGQAELVRGAAKRSLKRAQALSMVVDAEPRKLDIATSNSLMRWSRQRGHYLGLASAAAAWSILYARAGWAASGWFFNPYYGMYGFIPYRGHYCGWYGNCYYAPTSVHKAFTQPARASTGAVPPSGSHGIYGYDANNGYATSSQRTYETYSSPATSPSAQVTATALPEARVGESAAPRGGEGGGRSQ